MVAVESAGSGGAKVKVTIPDYSDQSPWSVVKGSDGSSSFSMGSMQGVSLATAGDTLWGLACDFSNTVKLISSAGSTWGLRPESLGAIDGAKLIEHNGQPVVSGVTESFGSAVAKVFNGSAWAEVT